LDFLKFLYVIVLSRLKSLLSKDEMRRDSVRMVADVTETRNVIPSLEFKTCMTIKP